MRTLLLIAGLLLTSCSFSQLYAQELSREEKKEWKRKAKDYRRNPAELKELVEDKNSLEREVDALSAQVNELEAEKTNRRSRIAQLEREVVNLQNSLAETQNALDRAQSEPRPSRPAADDMSGLVFKVQLGAYSQMNVPEDLDGEGDNLNLEQEDGMQKIIVGKFRDIENADRMKVYMQRIGISDAWVVAYQDGIRVPVESVVPGYTQ